MRNMNIEIGKRWRCTIWIKYQFIFRWNMNAMTFISDPIQKESYQIAVPKQYRMLIDAAAIIIPLMKKKVDIGAL